MLGLKRLEADFVYAAPPATFTPPLDATTGEGLLEIGFQVEEEEMLVDLEMRITHWTATPVLVDFTLFVDGTDIETVGTNGLARQLNAAAGAGGMQTLTLSKTLRLAKGFHVADVRLISAEVVNLAGATIPCELVARRHSHPATLGHGVDSKVQLVQ
jgi:hypothetical protein